MDLRSFLGGSKPRSLRFTEFVDAFTEDPLGCLRIRSTMLVLPDAGGPTSTMPRCGLDSFPTDSITSTICLMQYSWPNTAFVPAENGSLKTL